MRWFDPSGPARKLMSEVHLAIAVDTGEGLIVPVLRDVGSKSAARVPRSVERPQDAHARAHRDATTRCATTRSRCRTSARSQVAQATPLVVPPTVAILGSGKLQRDVVAGATAPEIHTRIPLSLTFDHRCITGGEACRFLAAVIADLAKVN